MWSSSKRHFLPNLSKEESEAGGGLHSPSSSSLCGTELISPRPILTSQTHDWGGLRSRTERRGNGVRPKERTPCHAHQWWMSSLPGLHCPSSSLLGGSAIPPHFKRACSDLVLSMLGILHMYLSSPLYNSPERSDLFFSSLQLRKEKKLQDIQDHRKLQDSGSGASDTQVCSYSNRLTFLKCITYALNSKVPTS